MIIFCCKSFGINFIKLIGIVANPPESGIVDVK
jgi:hypothetical protein